MENLAKETPILSIELTNMGDVPKVLYKGEEIKGKVNVSFDWGTKEVWGEDNTYFNIKHADGERDNPSTLNVREIYHSAIDGVTGVDKVKFEKDWERFEEDRKRNRSILKRISNMLKGGKG